MRGTLPLDLGSLATANFPATDLVQRRWPIGEERKGTRPISLAMNESGIIRVGHQKRPDLLWLNLYFCLVAGARTQRESLTVPVEL